MNSAGVDSVIFDTDVLIWLLRGNAKAARAVDRAESRSLSIVSYMELLQGARNKTELRTIKSMLADLRFDVLPLTENIGHRASIFMEAYTLSDALSMADALIAATAAEAGLPLLTGNAKRYNAVADLAVKRFRP